MRRTVLLTGANGGIGSAIALHLAGRGDTVIASVRDEVKAEWLRERAQRAGRELTTVLLDVTDPDSCARAVAEARQHGGGRIDVLINNAGMGMGGAIEDITDDDAHAIMELNTHGPIRLARLVLPVMRRQRAGRIVNVSSLAGRVSMPLMGWYCASKQALEAASDALRMEAARFGVRVILVEPGSHATKLWDGVFQRMDPSRDSPYAGSYRLLEKAKPHLSRLPGPEPVARAVGRVLDARRPRARYVVGLDARVSTVLDAVSPLLVSDLTKRAMFGLLVGSGSGRAAHSDTALAADVSAV
jgi:NAD(P)-dependent dehydrogenase (short-subunit alcohol dehydrogenase family)